MARKRGVLTRANMPGGPAALLPLPPTHGLTTTKRTPPRSGTLLKIGLLALQFGKTFEHEANPGSNPSPNADRHCLRLTRGPDEEIRRPALVSTRSKIWAAARAYSRPTRRRNLEL